LRTAPVHGKVPGGHTDILCVTRELGRCRDSAGRGKGAVVVDIPADIPSELEPSAKEIHRVHESAVWNSQGHFEQMKLWRAMNMVLGVPASVLAAIAGGTGLAATQATSVPGILALTAAGFGAALTTLNPSRRAELAH